MPIGMELVSIHLDDDPPGDPDEIDEVSIVVLRRHADVELEQPGEHLVVRQALREQLLARAEGMRTPDDRADAEVRLPRRRRLAAIRSRRPSYCLEVDAIQLR